MPRPDHPYRSKHSKRQRAAQREVRDSKKIIWKRCKGFCELCGVFLVDGAWEYSHRAQKGAGGGGDGGVCNGLASCSPMGCNWRLSADADFAVTGRANGWLIPRYSDPACEPVWLFAHGWSLLLPDGDVNPVDVDGLTA